MLAASANGDRKATFRVGSTPVERTIENWTGFIGQPDTRLWKPEPDMTTPTGNAQAVPYRKDWAVSASNAKWDLSDKGSPAWSPRYPDDYLGLQPGYIKRAPVAWFASHYHTPDGRNQPYAYSYLFAYRLPMAPHTTTLTLPQDPAIRILAISVAKQPAAVEPAQPVYDMLPETEPAR